GTMLTPNMNKRLIQHDAIDAAHKMELHVMRDPVHAEHNETDDVDAEISALAGERAAERCVRHEVKALRNLDVQHQECHRHPEDPVNQSLDPILRHAPGGTVAAFFVLFHAPSAATVKAAAP